MSAYAAILVLPEHFFKFTLFMFRLNIVKFTIENYVFWSGLTNISLTYCIFVSCFRQSFITGYSQFIPGPRWNPKATELYA